MKTNIIVAILCFVLIFLILACCRTEVQTAPVEYVVKSGDTLWSIADEYAPESMSKGEYIFNIKHKNALKTSDIYPGMVLEIEKAVE